MWIRNEFVAIEPDGSTLSLHVPRFCAAVQFANILVAGADQHKNGMASMQDGMSPQLDAPVIRIACGTGFPSSADKRRPRFPAVERRRVC